MQLLKNIKPS